MNRRIYKYRAPMPMTSSDIVLPKGAEVVHVGVQNAQLMIWAKVDPRAQLETRPFAVVATGHPFSESAIHVGTVVLEQLVWHLLELPR